ncbi:hypothetical protein [Streptomyces sp. NPDC058653]|uniref:hypothetical protein n=1 Tax=Streptomyces sp. NPDC058653 TaxID=3346576 RepID=UPI003660233E
MTVGVLGDLGGRIRQQPVQQRFRDVGVTADPTAYESLRGGGGSKERLHGQWRVLKGEVAHLGDRFVSPAWPPGRSGEPRARFAEELRSPRTARGTL